MTSYILCIILNCLDWYHHLYKIVIKTFFVKLYSLQMYHRWNLIYWANLQCWESSQLMSQKSDMMKTYMSWRWTSNSCSSQQTLFMCKVFPRDCTQFTWATDDDNSYMIMRIDFMRKKIQNFFKNFFNFFLFFGHPSQTKRFFCTFGPKITYFYILGGQQVHLTPPKCFLEA